jgi:hypothetical protein
MELTGKQREKLHESLRITLAIFGGGMMLCFSNFAVLLGLVPGAIFFILVILFGMLIGMIITELQHAVVAGLAAMAAGYLILFGFILVPLPGTVISLQMVEARMYFALESMFRSLLLEVMGTLLGTVVGRIVGPEWYALRIPKHELKVGIPDKEDAGAESI